MIPPRIIPFAEQALLPESNTQPMNDRCAGLVLHTAVDAPGPTNLPGYFARGDISAESTLWLPLDGTVVQLMYVGQRADATGSGNRFERNGLWWGFDSIETEDEGRPEEVPWTDAQVESLVRLMVWYHENADVPAQIADGPQGRGFGFHSMWGRTGIFGPVSSTLTNPWTRYQGKTCPGNRRVQQFKDEVWPAFKAAISPTETRTEETDMVELWFTYPDGKPGRKEARPFFFVGPWGGVEVDAPTANTIAATWRGQGIEIVRNLTNGTYDLQRRLVEQSMRAQAAPGVNPHKIAKAVVDELAGRLAA